MKITRIDGCSAVDGSDCKNWFIRAKRVKLELSGGQTVSLIENIDGDLELMTSGASSAYRPAENIIEVSIKK